MRGLAYIIGHNAHFGNAVGGRIIAPTKFLSDIATWQDDVPSAFAPVHRQWWASRRIQPAADKLTTWSKSSPAWRRPHFILSPSYMVLLEKCTAFPRFQIKSPSYIEEEQQMASSLGKERRSLRTVGAYGFVRHRSQPYQLYEPFSSFLHTLVSLFVCLGLLPH